MRGSNGPEIARLQAEKTENRQEKVQKDGLIERVDKLLMKKSFDGFFDFLAGFLQAGGDFVRGTLGNFG